MAVTGISDMREARSEKVSKVRCVGAFGLKAVAVGSQRSQKIAITFLSGLPVFQYEKTGL